MNRRGRFAFGLYIITAELITPLYPNAFPFLVNSKNVGMLFALVGLLIGSLLIASSLFDE